MLGYNAALLGSDGFMGFVVGFVRVSRDRARARVGAVRGDP